jgi:hypothetical protein
MRQVDITLQTSEIVRMVTVFLSPLDVTRSSTIKTAYSVRGEDQRKADVASPDVCKKLAKVNSAICDFKASGKWLRQTLVEDPLNAMPACRHRFHKMLCSYRHQRIERYRGLKNAEELGPIAVDLELKDVLEMCPVGLTDQLLKAEP